jgi:hypothetical protein
MKLSTILFVPVWTGALLMAGCGSGGGDDAPPTSGGNQPVTSTPLGSLAMPDGTVTVTAITPLVPGQQASFRITIPDMKDVAMVEAMVGTDYEDPAINTSSALPTTQAGADGWVASLVLPNPMPTSCRVLVRITDTDGGMQESGLDHFTIPTP